MTIDKYQVHACQQYLHQVMLKNLGIRPLSRERLRELVNYWTSFIFTAGPAQRAEQKWYYLADDLATSLLQQKSRFCFGIDLYNRKAGTDLAKIVENHLTMNYETAVLDIGCGHGSFITSLNKTYNSGKYHVTGHGLANMNPAKKEKFNFTLGLAELLPAAWKNKFDLVTCLDSSHEFWDQKRAFSEALRVTAPRGHLFYGTNSLRPRTNNKLLAELLWADGERYINSQGIEFTGIMAIYNSRLDGFKKFLTDLTMDGDRFEMHGKIFDIKGKEVDSQCPYVLQVHCLP